MLSTLIPAGGGVGWGKGMFAGWPGWPGRPGVVVRCAPWPMALLSVVASSSASAFSSASTWIAEPDSVSSEMSSRSTSPLTRR